MSSKSMMSTPPLASCSSLQVEGLADIPRRPWTQKYRYPLIDSASVSEEVDRLKEKNVEVDARRCARRPRAPIDYSKPTRIGWFFEDPL